MLNDEEIEKLVDRYFHGKENYNCAQSVLCIVKEKNSLNKIDIDTASAWGGGRSPDGLCGALYALLSQTPKEQHEKIISEFKSKVGSIKCREIRKANTTSCKECVKIASKIFNVIKS